MCGYVRTTFGTIIANCDWSSYYRYPYRRVWEEACSRNVVWSSVLPFSCWHLAIGDNVQVDFWGMYPVLCIFLSTAKYFSASWPSFPVTRGFVWHYVLWCSEFSPFSFRGSRLCARISAFSWHFNVACSPACASWMKFGYENGYGHNMLRITFVAEIQIVKWLSSSTLIQIIF